MCIHEDEVVEYTRLMSEDVLELEAVRRRVEEAARSTLSGLWSLNVTVTDIETRSAAALNTTQLASQVTCSRCCY